MSKTGYYIVNTITLYRLLAAPVLIFLVFTKNIDLFKWLLPVSFFTDAIDGILARTLKVSSKFGAKLDSIADDLTALAGITGLFVLKFQFVKDNWVIIGTIILLLIAQYTLALIKYHKISSFHTYLAKVAALLQGSFLILMFLLPEPLYPLFYTASAITILDLIEEIILVFYLPVWTTNVKGLYWVMRKKKTQG